VSERTLGIGAAGLGRAFTLMLPTFLADKRVQLVAAADPRAEARKLFAKDFSAPAYESVDELCGNPEVEAVYVATPHQLHADHVRLAATRGKHVLVEKPMAISVAECQAMIDAARKAKVHIVVGHSHSFDAPYLRAREIIASGAAGQARMITALNFTDYMYRPRRAEEMVTAQGGGVIFSQGAHQIDIVRLLGGGRVKSVRAATASWDPNRPTEGAYSALLSFADGAFASVVYSGYGRFDSDEFTNWIGEMGSPKDRSRYGAARKALQNTDAAKEAALKAARNYGGADYKGAPAPSAERLHQHFGLLLVSCERADLRPTPEGVMIYADDTQRLDKVAVRDVARAEVIDEFYNAAVHGRAPLHSGAWALATLEVCLAMLQSAREGRDIELQHQIGVPA